jgi:hypothetical protein
VAHDGEKLVGAWVPYEFSGALEMLAKMRGESQSDVIREALTRTALEAAGGEDHGGAEAA